MLNKISATIFLLILVELCLGGGGRFTAIGPVSLRMILFSMALVLSMTQFLKGSSFPFEIRLALAGFVCMISVGIVIGIVNGNPTRLIYEDVKPLCYFLVLPFFYLSMDETMVVKTIRTVKMASVAMALIFMVLLVVINSGIIPFLDFYRATLKSEELFYRGEATFFYKGFLYLGIGIIFYYFTGYSKLKKYVILLLLVAIALSVTRGLVFSLGLTFAIYFLVTKNYGRASVAFAMAVIIAIWGSDLILSGSRIFDAGHKNISYLEANPNLLGDRNYSDQGRVTQAREVWHELSSLSAISGHGFGKGTPSRPIHMEISYLEIFHKQGLIGLLFWGSLAGMIFVRYLQAPASSVAHAFFFSAIFVFIESFTNQYINNPIGLSMLLLSLVCLYKLKTKA